MKIKTTTLELPEGERFEDAVGRIRADARIGHRVSRATYLAEVGRRDAEYLADEETGPIEPLKKSYQAAQDLVR